MVTALVPKPADWNSLKEAFLTRFRPQSYHNTLQDQLQSFQMYQDETIAGYYTRLETYFIDGEIIRCQDLDYYHIY